jgi:peroxiredoxin
MLNRTKLKIALAALLTVGVISGYAGTNDKPSATSTTPDESSLVGKKAPNFTLTDTDGKTHSLQEYLAAGKTVVLHWYNPNCPFIIRHFKTYPTFTTLYTDYNKKNVVVLAINSTGPKHPQYGGDAASKKTWGIQYPILLDPNGDVGKMYGAKTTPHTFVISSDGVVRYSGAIDNDPQDKLAEKDKLNYARQALDEILAGKPVSVPETRPYGCGVHYSE